METPLSLPWERTRADRWAAVATGFVLSASIALAYYLLLSNPGYFSHDELQWGAHADVSRWTELPWQGWTDFAAFQHRPLTFNLWLLIAHRWFAQPLQMHAIWLLIGGLNCLLLFCCLRQLNVARAHAFAGAAAFAASPYAVYVHGWTATLADLLWLGATLALLFGLLRLPTTSRWRAGTVALLLTTAALLAKEAALIIAPLLLFAWLMDKRQPRVAAALLASGLVTAVYLWLRLPTLLFSPRIDGAYAWSMTMPLRRWTEMQVFPYLPTALEFSSVNNASMTRFALALVMAIGVMATVFSASKRLGVTLLVGGALAMGPPLLLAVAYPQYGYGYAAFACGCAALTWARLRVRGKSMLLLALLVSSWHGINVAREMHRIGTIQRVYSPALAAAVTAHAQNSSSPSTVLRLAVANADDRGVFQRLTRQIPAYSGIAIGERVQLVGPNQSHDAVIRADGSVAWPNVDP
ncbi:MAG: hypothetical protein ACT4NL_15880 [Pseudomarimonas sp.]